MPATSIGPPEWNRRITTVGITGTNGKTSTTRWVAACLACIGRPVAQTTTLGSFLDDAPFDATRDFDGFLATMRAALDRGGASGHRVDKRGARPRLRACVALRVRRLHEPDARLDQVPRQTELGRSRLSK